MLAQHLKLLVFDLDTGSIATAATPVFTSDDWDAYKNALVEVYGVDDLLSSKERVFENYEEIRAIAKEVTKELGYYVKLADWSKKDYLRARIKTALKKILANTIDARISYREIDKMASEILTHAEMVYVYGG